MSKLSNKIKFLESEEAAVIKRILRAMVLDETYNTEPTYSANSGLYPNNLIPFLDKHMAYLSTHPDLDPQQYISNLRLMTRKR